MTFIDTNFVSTTDIYYSLVKTYNPFTGMAQNYS